MSAAPADAGHAAPRRAAGADPQPPGGHRAQPPPAIQQRTGFDLNVIKEAIEELRHLNLRPGSQFSAEHAPYVVPDILVERNEDGEYTVRLLDDWLPNIYISRRYIDLLREKGADPKTKEYLKRKIQAATVAPGVDRAAAQHSGESDEGDHQAPASLPGQGAGAHRAAEDAADRRPGGRPRDDGEPGGGRQVGADAARRLPAEALLRRRHADGQRRGGGLGDRSSRSCWRSSTRKTRPIRCPTRTSSTKLQESGYPVARRTVTKYRKMLSIPSSRQRKDWTA